MKNVIGKVPHCELFKELALLLLIIGTVVFGSLSISASAHAEACNLELAENGRDFNVTNDSGEVLGYLSQNADGSWFIWHNGIGALNDLVYQRNVALKKLCDVKTKSN